MAEAGFMRNARGRGERGASFSMSLLLFLVCTIAASIVIASATITAGRATNLANDDQLFYSVSSASAVLSREIDGSSPIDLSFKKNDSGESYELFVGKDGDMKPVSNVQDLSLLEWATVCAYVGEIPGEGTFSDALSNMYNEEGEFQLLWPSERIDYPSILYVNLKDNISSSDIMPVTVRAQVDTDRTLVLTVEAKDPLTQKAVTEKLVFDSAPQPVPPSVIQVEWGRIVNVVEV